MIASDISQKKRLYNKYSKAYGVSYAEKLVYCYLEFTASENGCFPSIKTISAECSISKPSVIKALRNLENAGFIKTKKILTKKNLVKNFYEILSFDEYMELSKQGNFKKPMSPEELREQKEKQKLLKLKQYSKTDWFYKMAKILKPILQHRNKKNNLYIQEGANILESLANKHTKKCVKECIAFLRYQTTLINHTDFIDRITTYKGFRQYFTKLKELYESFINHKLETESLNYDFLEKQTIGKEAIQPILDKYDQYLSGCPF